jgi:HTH-type transcriptional regulator/antitoxin HipB
MSDLKKYIRRRKLGDKAFSKNYDEGYAEFKIGVFIKNLREASGFTQQKLAEAMHTKKSAISRIENESADIRLSTLFKIAAVLGKNVNIRVI